MRYKSALVSGALMLIGFLIVACRPVAITPLPAAELTRPAFEPFLEPDGEQKPVLAAIEDAKQTIRVEMYLLNDSQIMDALALAQARGVNVRVILEAQPTGAGTGNKPAALSLQSAGVGVRTGATSFQATHSKMMIIDDRLALIMTFDQTRAAFTTNRGVVLFDRQPQDIAEMIHVFDADWDRTAPTLGNEGLVWGPADSRGRLLAFIDGADKTLDIETGQLQDAQILEYLISAEKRGTAVRLVMGPTLNGPDLNAVGRERLSSAGVQVRMLRKPWIAGLIMVADGTRGFMGSQELTALSLDKNRELGILVTQKRTVDGLQGTFRADWEIAK